MSGNAKSVSEARARYGKPFATEVKVGRMRPKSFWLQHLESLSAQPDAPERAPVVPIGANGSSTRRQR